jgi:hypothetical protein
MREKEQKNKKKTKKNKKKVQGKKEKYHTRNMKDMQITSEQNMGTKVPIHLARLGDHKFLWFLKVLHSRFALLRLAK